VVAEQGLGQAELQLRTRSVTAARRRVLVAVIAVEDLAVAAETTREPAVPEAAVAWAVAVTAVAGVGIAVAVAAVE
jgi:hypothetical protein